MPAPKKKLDVSPSEVTFDLRPDQSPTCVLTLTNSSEESVAYKIKTTTPKRYLVKPNQEILLPGAAISVTVVLQAKESAALLEQPVVDSKDKFLVATVVVDDAFVSQVNAARSAPKELQTLFANLWEKKEKDDFKNLRMGCKFNTGRPSAPAAAAAPASPSAAPAASPMTAQKPSAAKPAAATPATPVSAAAAADRKPHSAVAATPVAADEDASVTQQRYKELLTLLVQVTDERDRFQTSYKDATKELMALKNSLKGRENSGSVKTVNAAGAYQLWHLLLVCVVTFIVARLVSTFAGL
jgi:hypothetical protein